MIFVLVAPVLRAWLCPREVMRLARRGGLRLSLLTWGGLRGGISIALALTLPAGRPRDVMVVATYGIVAFSLLGQATTMPWLLRRTLAKDRVGGNEEMVS